MSYRLKFIPSAQKEWSKLGATIKNQFKKKLAERLENPEVPGDRLRGQERFYKIKLRSAGYRLVYEVENKEVTIYVISVGKRDNLGVYKKAKGRKRS